MWYLAGETVNLSVDFIVDAEFVVPTEATYTVRDVVGNPFPNLTSVAMTVSSTSGSVSVPDTNNTIVAGADSENRFVEVRFLFEGKEYRNNYNYKLRPFVPLMATPNQVRVELGLSDHELPDRDIDLYQSYLYLKQDYSDIEVALATAGLMSISANQALVVKSALDVVSSLPLRAAIKLKAEDAAVERSSDIDFDKLQKDLSQKLTSLLDSIQGVAGDDASGGYARLVLTNPADVITG